MGNQLFYISYLPSKHRREFTFLYYKQQNFAGEAVPLEKTLATACQKIGKMSGCIFDVRKNRFS
ncbi:hypothetical protein [Methylomonas sp. AM2-LC]|uniref:hypothetical protein n=1 Tax=Methylomonas sp. AM2-LC TaxID=3153301 RepID=UPI0032668A3A